MDYKIPEDQKTGILLNHEDIKLQREYFKEMVRLIGINVLFRTPIKGMKKEDRHGELDSKYNPPVVVGCIFSDHLDQKTCKKMGWNSERLEEKAVISVPYDLEVERGCLFIIPTGIDGAQGRVFKVTDMSNIQLYPSSISCELGPMYEDEMSETETEDFTQSDMNVLNDGDLFDGTH